MLRLLLDSLHKLHVHVGYSHRQRTRVSGIKYIERMPLIHINKDKDLAMFSKEQNYFRFSIDEQTLAYKPQGFGL